MEQRVPAFRRAATGLLAFAITALAGACSQGSSGSLAALSPLDGQEQWGRSDVLVGGALAATDDAIAVVGYERCSNEGRLTVLDSSTGATQWSTPIEGGFGARSVAIASDLVVSSTTSGVRALEIGDGTERWMRPVAWSDPLIAANDGSIAIAELVQSTDRRSFTSRLGVVDHDDGTTRWEIEFPDEQVIDLVVDDAVVFARLSGMSEERAGHTTVVAIDTASGVIRWTSDLGVSEIGTELHVADHTVVVNLQTISWFAEQVQLGPSSAIVALDQTDGAERWRIDGPVDDDTPPPGSPVMGFDANGSTVIGRDVDGLVAWDTATGTVRWRLPPGPGNAWIVDDQVLWSPLVGPDGGGDRLDAADLDTGENRWSTTTDGWVRDVGSARGLLLAASVDSASCD